MRDDRPDPLARPSPDRPPEPDRQHAPDRSRGPDLSRRLESLPPGHPSSPYEADGTPRRPAPRLRDLDTGPAERTDRPRPFTDAEWDDHVTEVRTRLDKAQADGLATDRQFTIDPDGQSWNEERRAVQDLIINSIYADAEHVPSERKAIVAGGLPGAGKTTVLGGHAGIDQSQYLIINPDNIKEKLAERGQIPEVSGLSPMEASDLVHEESSYVARQLALRAQADGKNLIWDITMSSRASAERRIDDLRAAGYAQVDGVFVDIPLDVSTRRADARHRQGEEDYKSGIGLGGRYVPPDINAAQDDSVWGSQNRRTFEQLKPRFDQWSLYDNSVDNRGAILSDTGHRDYSPEELSS